MIELKLKDLIGFKKIGLEMIELEVIELEMIGSNYKNIFIFGRLQTPNGYLNKNIDYFYYLNSTEILEM